MKFGPEVGLTIWPAEDSHIRWLHLLPGRVHVRICTSCFSWRQEAQAIPGLVSPQSTSPRVSVWAQGVGVLSQETNNVPLHPLPHLLPFLPRHWSQASLTIFDRPPLAGLNQRLGPCRPLILEPLHKCDWRWHPRPLLPWLLVSLRCLSLSTNFVFLFVNGDLPFWEGFCENQTRW